MTAGSRPGPACQHGGVHRDVVVVGGGIAGLAAAHELALAGRDVLLLEGSPETGGKLRVREVAGVGVDVGAEAMLNRRPEGVDLARAVGLDIEHPVVVSSRIWTGGALRPLPRSLMGVPLDLDQLEASGVLDDAALARVRAEPSLPPTDVGDDLSVGDLVDARRELRPGPARRPLLGEVYAGRARRTSPRARAAAGSCIRPRADVHDPGSLVDRVPSVAPAGAASVPCSARASRGGMRPTSRVPRSATAGGEVHAWRGVCRYATWPRRRTASS